MSEHYKRAIAKLVNHPRDLSDADIAAIRAVDPYLANVAVIVRDRHGVPPTESEADDQWRRVKEFRTRYPKPRRDFERG